MGSKIEFVREGFREFCGRADRHVKASPTITESGEVENPFGFATVVDAGALIGFGQLDDMDRDMINCDKAIALVMRWDQPRKRPDRPEPVAYDRYEAVPFCLAHDGTIHAGGTRHADETRHGGWVKIVDPQDRRRYKIVTVAELSSPAAGHAVGQSRRGDIEGKDHSLKRTGNDPSDRLLLDAYCWLVSAARKRKAEGSLSEGKAIDSRMQFEVEALSGRPLTLRWDDSRWGDHQGALRAVDEIVARNVKNGTWQTVALTDRGEGVVTHVTDNLVIVRYGGDGEGAYAHEHALPVTIRDQITALTGIPCEDMPIVPLVEPRQRVNVRTSLFGPTALHAMSDAQTVHALAAEVSAGPMNTLMRLRQWRAWATVAEAREEGGKKLYPLALVVPDDLRRTYLRLGANKLQHLTLIEGVPGSLRADPSMGVGYRIDLFDHSQRSKMLSDMTKPRQTRAPAPKKQHRTNSRSKRPSA